LLWVLVRISIGMLVLTLCTPAILEELEREERMNREGSRLGSRG
jgi:hypothetical protein